MISPYFYTLFIAIKAKSLFYYETTIINLMEKGPIHEIHTAQILTNNLWPHQTSKHPYCISISRNTIKSLEHMEMLHGEFLIISKADFLMFFWKKIHPDIIHFWLHLILRTSDGFCTANKKIVASRNSWSVFISHSR